MFSRSCSCSLKVLTKEPLLTATVIGVLAGVAGGCLLYALNPSERVVEVVGFPGEILMNLLRLIVLPLIAGSMVAGVCSLRESTVGMGRVARVTVLYYVATTFTAVVLGILVVTIIKPGRGKPFSGAHRDNAPGKDAKDKDILDAVFDILRSLFPSNVVKSAADMNILGIITASIMFGLGLAAQGPEGNELVQLVHVFNKTIEQVVVWILYYAPFGIFSLIMHNIAVAEDLTTMVTSMGLFIVSVLLGLVLQAFVVIPVFYFLFTRKLPLKHYPGFAQALVTAFGTDSSSATLPVTMQCAEKLGAHEEVIGFVLPLGATVNMNGTALYEAVAVIFIAQGNGVTLSLADTIVVALVATLAAVGAAGIPEAGLVTMLMVLKAVNMEEYAFAIGMIFTIDWFLDRCRTVVNVLGDSMAVMAINEIMYKDDHPGQYAQLQEVPGEAAVEAGATIE